MDAVALRGVQRNRPPAQSITFSDEILFIAFRLCTIHEPAVILNSSWRGVGQDEFCLETSADMPISDMEIIISRAVLTGGGAVMLMKIWQRHQAERS